MSRKSTTSTQSRAGHPSAELLRAIAAESFGIDEFREGQGLIKEQDDLLVRTAPDSERHVSEQSAPAATP